MRSKCRSNTNLWRTKLMDLFSKLLRSSSVSQDMACRMASTCDQGIVLSEIALVVPTMLFSNTQDTLHKCDISLSTNEVLSASIGLFGSKVPERARPPWLLLEGTMTWRSAQVLPCEMLQLCSASFRICLLCSYILNPGSAFRKLL